MKETRANLGPLRDEDSVLRVVGVETVLLEVKGNGDIFVKGKLIHNDKGVAEALWKGVGEE